MYHVVRPILGGCVYTECTQAFFHCSFKFCNDYKHSILFFIKYYMLSKDDLKYATECPLVLPKYYAIFYTGLEHLWVVVFVGEVGIGEMALDQPSKDTEEWMSTTLTLFHTCMPSVWVLWAFRVLTIVDWRHESYLKFVAPSWHKSFPSLPVLRDWEKRVRLTSYYSP